jgi:hypothetical protein
MGRRVITLTIIVIGHPTSRHVYGFLCVEPPSASDHPDMLMLGMGRSGDGRVTDYLGRPLIHPSRGPTQLTLPLMVDDWSQAVQHDVMRVYRAKRDEAHSCVNSKYAILGFISSGTYGRVYKAQSKDEDAKLHAIKKFKPDKDGDIATYTGISQSAIREIAVSICLYCFLWTNAS